MGSINVSADYGEFIFKCVADKALRSQMVAFIGPDFFYGVEDAGVVLQGGYVEHDIAQDMPDAPESVFGVL